MVLSSKNKNLSPTLSKGEGDSYYKIKNNKTIVIVSLLSFVLFLVNCSSNHKQTDTDIVCVEPTDTIGNLQSVNPNGDSELAVLMREMMHSSENLKELIKQGKLPEKFPEEFLTIHTAQATDSETKKASFDGFASNYISNLQALYQSPKEELTKNYNAVIASCASCHSEHCPGPLKAINKLKI